MDILELHTDDYTLTIRAQGVDTSFSRAFYRNNGMLLSTEYSFSGGALKGLSIASAEQDKLSDQLSPIGLQEKKHPVFFENKDYLFDIAFKVSTDNQPVVYSPLKEIKQAFIPRKINGNYFVTGAINYGNELGKSSFVLKYNKAGVSYQHTLGFEVFPVKMDYKNDYNSIILDINKEFSALVLEVLRKTYAGYKDGNELSNDVVWWSVFGRLCEDILHSAKLILNKPHNRLVKHIHFTKADRIHQLTPILEEQITEHRNNESKYYREEKKTNTVDTSENRFFKYVMNEVYRKFIMIKTQLLYRYKFRITLEFEAELDKIETSLAVITHHPFFKQIGHYKGIKQESLVLQKASGYSSIFRSWIILKKGIDFLDGVNKIELKNMAELYQIWCFLEMKNMVQEILHKEPEEVDLAEILIEGFTVQLRSGKNSRITFRKDNGDLVELFHELKYYNKDGDENKSYTINQEPDIVVRVTKSDLQEKYQFTYIFDAKYRLASDDKYNAHDFPTDDSINQMHRYRDAIFYQSGDNRPKKEVIGAYILFPGTDNEKDLQDLYYQKSIIDVNIGAFPLLPGSKKDTNKGVLTNFLKSILETKTSDNILQEDIIPQKGMTYEDPDAYVLAGFTSRKEQIEYLMSDEPNLVYHMPVYRKSGLLNTIKNLDKLKYFAPIIEGIKFFFEIEDIQVLSRKEIFPSQHALYRDGEESYYVFKLRNRKKLKNNIMSVVGGNRVFRYARFSELKNCKSINDFNKVVQEV